MGGSTVKAIVGNKIAPRLLDQYLGRTGYESQQTPDREDPNRQNNLWAAVDSTQDYGARGAFSTRARDSSYELWADLHRPLIAVGVGISAIALGLLFGKRRKHTPGGEAVPKLSTISA